MTLDESAYFVRESDTRFRPTALVGGAWSLEEQHIAPAIGLLAHCIERDRDTRRPDDGLQLTRLSSDILGVVPIEAVDVEVQVLRPGRTIELVEARMVHAGRAVVLARGWLSRRSDTAALEASPLAPLPRPEDVPPWDLGDLWPGAFVRTLDIRRQESEAGSAVAWVDTAIGLVAGEPTSSTATALGLIDTANGTTPRMPPARVAFPNLDLTAHLFRAPQPGPVGFDVRVSFGPDGAGLTLTTLHDLDGPFGSAAQTLTLRAR
jgi:hypothetical protein